MDVIERYWAGRTFYEIQSLHMPSVDEKNVSILTKFMERHPNTDFNERAEFSEPYWSDDMIEQRFIVYFSDCHSLSALVCAILTGCIKTARFLLAYGANVNLPNYYLTPILAATYYSRSLEWIKLLVEYGADVNRKCDRSGKTALHNAVKGYDMIEIVEYLLLHGADSRAVDNKGRTPMDLCNNPELRKCFERGSATKSARSASIR